MNNPAFPRRRMEALKAEVERASGEKEAFQSDWNLGYAHGLRKAIEILTGDELPELKGHKVRKSPPPVKERGYDKLGEGKKR